MNIGANTDKGKIREQNEDALGYRDNLFVIADGMGGHEAGEIASAIAVETILAYNFGFDVKSGLFEAVAKANEVILAEIEKNPNLNGMGTTVAVLLLKEEEAYVTHVGDSRIYQLTDNNLVQLTTDHSFVAELVKNGSITEEEAKTHPQRNILTKALGTKGNFDYEVNTFLVRKGDKFLLCSDGLTSMIEEKKIQEVLSDGDPPQDIADELIRMANENGGTDNISVIVIEV